MRGNVTILYRYGVKGLSSIVVKKDEDTQEYVCRTNILGDVIAIYNTEGDLQCKYNYDAWGNHRVGNARNELIYDSATGVIATGYESHIAILNPIRYRGYYYDTETGLYYLQSRYYDATLCRFLNRDNVNYLEPESIHGLNLYAYCNNNPVMFADPSGHEPKWLVGIVRIITGIGAFVAGTLVIASGVALAPMLIIAGITICAGVMTVVNGAADVQQSITGNNFIRDGIFCGNQTAYDWYAGDAEGVAIIGSLICGGWLKANRPRIQAFKNVGNYDYTKSVKKYFPNAEVVMKGNEFRPYAQSTWAQKNIIKYGKMAKDLYGYKFIYGNAEIGVNIMEKMIWHMLIWG